MLTLPNEQRNFNLLSLKTNYDVVILGGGPAGLAAAISILQQMKLSVLVVESKSAEHERIGESCPPETLFLLEKLASTKAFHGDNHARCPGFASVWGKGDVGYNDFIVNPLGAAWRLNRKKFDQMLADKAISKGAEIPPSLRFIDARKIQHENGYSLSLMSTIDKSAHAVEARFVIDATGSSAHFAKSIGVEKKVEDQLYAAVRFSTLVDGHISKQVLLEATENGWWYNALLPDNRIVSMMVTEKGYLSALRENNYQGFSGALRASNFIGPTLRSLTMQNHQYHVWPIYSGLLTRIEGADWVAIGDAASSYDPIVAQGIYKGLSDGIDAANKVVSVFKKFQAKEQNTFSQQVKHRYQLYLQNRAHLYALEQRWPTASFWLNRELKMPY